MQETILMKEDCWMTVKETADEFKVSGPAVRKWIDRGLKYKIRRAIGRKPTMVIRRIDVEDFICAGISDPEEE